MVIGRWIAGADGSDPVRVAGDWHSVSPDSKHIAYQSDDSCASYGVGPIGVMGADGAAQLADRGRISGWSPDGKHVAYNVWTLREDADPGDCHRSSFDVSLWVSRADGSGAQKLADNGAFGGWSPDGQHLAYMASPGGGHELWVAAVDGSDAFVYTADTGDDSYELWVAAVDGSGAVKLDVWSSLHLDDVEVFWLRF